MKIEDYFIKYPQCRRPESKKVKTFGNYSFITELFYPTWGERGLDRLENEFNLVNSVYQELAKQVELSKIEITKDTPVFTILKSAEVPNDRFKPKRTIMVIIWFFIGLFLSIIYLFFIKKTKSLIFRIIN